MTLVVARANPLGARIISDSRINDPCEVKQRPLEGALKSVVVNQLQCVAFGGVLAFAQDAVESLFANRLHERGDDEIILAHLLDAHRGSSSATDFLLASLVGGTPVLHEVKDGVIAHHVAASWLGSRSAFASYQRAYHARSSNPPESGAPGDPDRSALDRMEHAFRVVVDAIEGEHDDVGDFMIEVRSSPAGFAYRRTACAFPGGAVTTGPEWQQVEFGDGSEGGYGYSVLCPDVVGLPFVAIYCPTGRLGAVFAPLQSRTPMLFSSATAENFIDAVHAQFGVRLSGFVIEGQGPRQVG